MSDDLWLVNSSSCSLSTKAFSSLFRISLSTSLSRACCSHCVPVYFFNSSCQHFLWRLRCCFSIPNRYSTSLRMHRFVSVFAIFLVYGHLLCLAASTTSLDLVTSWIQLFVLQSTNQIPSLKSTSTTELKHLMMNEFKIYENYASSMSINEKCYILTDIFECKQNKLTKILSTIFYRFQLHRPVLSVQFGAQTMLCVGIDRGWTQMHHSSQSNAALMKEFEHLICCLVGFSRQISFQFFRYLPMILPISCIE